MFKDGSFHNFCWSTQEGNRAVVLRKWTSSVPKNQRELLSNIVERYLSQKTAYKSEQNGTASSLESSRRMRLVISSGPVAFPILRDLRADSI